MESMREVTAIFKIILPAAALALIIALFAAAVDATPKMNVASLGFAIGVTTTVLGAVLAVFSKYAANRNWNWTYDLLMGLSTNLLSGGIVIIMLALTVDRVVQR